MKLNKSLIACAIMGGVTLLVSSCSSTKVTASFTMPPKAIAAKDLSKISTLRIVIDAKCVSDGKEQDNTFIAGILRERLAERLYQEGYYKITDIIWGDIQGAQQAFDNAEVRNSGHGYTRFNTDTCNEAATMTLTFVGKIVSEKKRGSVSYTLKEIPYRQYRDKDGVPRSEPDYKEVPKKDWKGNEVRDSNGNVIYQKVPIIIETKVTEQYDFLAYAAACSVRAVITDADGNQVYGGIFEAKCGERGDYNHHISRPTDAEIIARLFSDERVVGALVSDISPVKVKRDLVVNEKGDEKAILLLKANAYSEALHYLEKLVEKAENEKAEKKKDKANYENLGIAYEILGNIGQAEYNYKKADCQEGIKRIAKLRDANKGSRSAKKQLDTFKSDKENNGFNLKN